MSDRKRTGDRANTGLAAAVVAALGVACCGVMPLALAAVSSVAIGTALGVGAGILAIVALTALLIARTRRRRACAATRAGGSRSPRIVIHETEFEANVIQSFSHFVHFFVSPRDGGQWTAKHPGTFLISIEDAHLGRLTNRAVFGGALIPGGQR